jgi:iron complex outermembrane recepter protein
MMTWRLCPTWFLLYGIIAGGGLCTSVTAAEPVMTFDIPAEDLGSALRDFSRQSNQEILFSSDVVRGKSTRGIHGSLPPDAALAQLLANTGLIVSRTSGGSLLIADTKTAPGVSGHQDPPRGSISQSDAEKTELGEIEVTAQKYKSTVFDTPISLSALSGDQLQAAGITSVTEVARDVPGLSMRSAGPGITEYEARGLSSSGGATGTVGFYIDEVPLSPPGVSGSGKFISDPNLYDIERVEVLRGPQGTLYGSGSMGGTIKVITNQPKLGEFEGSVQGTASDTHHGGTNGGGNFMINIPLGDVMALRLVATDTYRSGWIDRVVLNPFPIGTYSQRGNVLAAPVQSVAKDANTENLYGGRLSILYKPSDDLSVLLTALVQRMNMDGNDLVDSPPGPSYLAHYQPFPVAEPVDDELRVFSLTMNARLPFADLTSVTSYYGRDFKQTQDISEANYLILGGPGVSPLPFIAWAISESDPARQITQEIRLSQDTGRLRWVAGGFYANLTTSWNELQKNTAAEPAAPNGVAFASDNPYGIKQAALFADGSFKITDQWTFSTGLRWYDYQTHVDVSEWGYYSSNATPPATPLVTTASNHGFNPRFNLSYEPNANLNTYVTAAKGFRLGGANVALPPPTVSPFCPAGVPESFGPDTVWNFEVGEKSKLLDNRLSINGDFYYLKWNSVQQIILLQCGFDYTANAGSARSFGPELEVVARIADSWTVSASGGYTDARLIHPTSAYSSSLYGSNGQNYCPGGNPCSIQLPNIPHATGALAVTYAAEVAPGYRLTALLNDAFTGSALDEAYYYGIHLPSYSIANARLTLDHDRWSASLFADNLANKLALITSNNTSFSLNIPALVRYSVNQPRTMGVQVNYKF